MKKRIVRFIGICLVLLLLTTTTFSQQGNAQVNTDYSRASVTFFMNTYPGDINSQNAASSAGKIVFSDKYFNHNLDRLSFAMGSDYKGLSLENKKAELKKYLETKGIGREMLAKWFSRQPDGMFNLDYIHQCGLYNASDQDVLMSGAAKRGEAVLFDAGQNLVNKTYVIIISPKDFTSVDDDEAHGWTVTYDIFLFKLDFDNEVVSRFYEQWPFNDDPDEVKRAKIAAFDTLTFTFTPFYAKANQMSAASEVKALTSKPKTMDLLFDEMVANMYTNTLFNMDKDLEPFRVKVNVSGTHPIRSKIGKKEGLHCDQRYFVYEFVWDDKTGTAKQDRKAVVRSTGRIADNRGVATGASPESQFYQVYGGTVRQGMLMQQRNDFGISLVPAYEVGGIGGFDIGVMIRSGFFTNVPSLYAMVDIGFDGGEYNLIDDETEQYDYTFIRYSVGLGKGFRFARIGELIPFFAWGQESTNDETYESIKTSFIKAGTGLGISLTPAVSLLGQVNFYAPYGGIVTKIKDEDKVTQDYNWTDNGKFDDRSGMSLLFGIRFEF